VAASDGRTPGIRAGDEQWRQLGELLQRRREELGYDHRPAFSEDRDINIRRVADIERNYRPNTYPVGALAKIARAYAVTYESVTAVLRGEAGGLSPAQDAAAGAPAPAVPLPVTDPARIARAAPHLARIWERVWVLAGSPDFSGAEMFGEGTADVRAWDAVAGRWPVPDRVWMIADLQARGDGPPGRREEGAAG